MMKTKDALDLINTIAPFEISEDWDNSGLQAGNPNWEVKKIMIGLDVSMSLMNSAKRHNCDLVLTHHPLMISPKNSFDFNEMPGSAIKIAAQQKISIISAHTNLDKANDGLNDYFATKIGIKKTKPLIESSLTDQIDTNIGIGRIGSLESPIILKALIPMIKDVLNLPHVRVTGNMDLHVTRVAVCTGSGGSLISDFLKSGADVFITGDIKYHEARLVEEYSKAIIDVGHFGSEHIAVDLLYNRLSQVIKNTGLNIEVKRYKKEKDPFTIV